MEILQELKHKGYRLTKPRQELVKILADYPLTVQEIYSVLKKKKIQIDLASVYRSLELFVQMGIVYTIDIGENKKRYELVNEKRHHHHLVCNNCGVIEDVQLREETLLKDVRKHSKFKIDHHHLEFFGVCAKCQDAL